MHYIFTTLLSLFLTGLSFVANGQSIHFDYTPIDSFRMPKEMFSEFRTGFSKWGQTTSLEKNKAKLAFIQLATQKLEFLASLDSAGLIMYNDSITSFLRSITERIVDSNEILRGHKITVFTYRSLEPNAFNVGEGIVLFSLGLLERLKTVDQIAFILAHEIGHDILRHVYEDNQRFCENFYDPQFKKTFKQTSRSRIGRNTQMRNLVNGFFAHHMSYSRANELVADSLGYVLATNAGFHPDEAFGALEVLDASDQLRYADTLPLQTIFDFNKSKFKSYWLNTDNSSVSSLVVSSKDAFPDSLKSHPDCAERIEKLMLQISPRDSSLHQDKLISDDLKAFNDLVSFETLGAVMQANDYVVALYLALHMQKNYPDNIYLKSVIAHCILELSEAMVDNEYLDYVQFPGPEFTAGYNHLLTFLHNMTSSSLKNIFQSLMDEWIGDVTAHRYVSFLKIVSDPEVILTDESIAEFDTKYHDEYLTNLLKERLLMEDDE